MSPSEQFQDPLVMDGWDGPWTVGTTASANLWLAPVSNFQVTIRAIASFMPKMLKSLTLSVNGQLIPLTSASDAGGGTIFSGTIPQSVVALDPSNTLFEFRTDKPVSPKSLGINAETLPVGVLLDWMQIQPIAS